jgi:pimeloyl-ACP methyl ester carboxylesterase
LEDSMTDQEFVAMQKSTAVRSRTVPWGVRLLRPALGALSAVAPALAAPVAERLFLAPPHHPQPAHEAAALASARSTIVDAGTPITAWTWGRGPAVLLVHGWGGRGGQLAAFVPPLVANGYSVVTFDAPGHGRSPAPESSLVAFVAAIHAVARALGPVHGVIAHSIGAAATACALRDGLAADAAVFLAPPADLTLHADIALEALGFGRRARELMRERIEHRLGVSWSTLDVASFAAQMPTPLLVIHDRDDAEVPWQEGAIIAQAWPGATLSTTSGLGHRRLVRDRDVVQETISFVLGELRWRRPAFAPAPEPVMAASVA